MKRVLYAITAIALFLSFSSCIDENYPSVPEQNDTIAVEESVKEADVTVETEVQEESKEVVETVTMGQKNALKKAKSYLNFMAFSYSGLIEQLEFEGFSNDEAVYGADNCGADWNDQAAKKAESYLEFMSFSRSGLIDQLVFEGFTQSQAEYGATAVGY